LKVIYHRAPNSIREDYIIRELKSFEREDIRKELSSMRRDSAIIRDVVQNLAIKEDTTSYRLDSCEGIPVRKTISIGGLQIPRLMDADPARAEDVNYLLESLAQYSNSLEDRFKQILKKRMKSYWANIITLFGVFIGLFSLINISISKITIDQSWTRDQIFWNNFEQILPTAIVLVIFMFLLKVLFGI